MRSLAKKVFAVFFILWILCYVYNNYLTKGMIVGTYINTNYQYKPFLVEIPYQSDTLTLLKNGTFTSSYWGKGKYRLLHKLFTTQIILDYHYEMGDASATFFMNRHNYLKPQIILFEVEQHFYRKIR
jgi:hypothetical protein